MSKDATYRKLINKARWKHLRLKKIQACPLCESCQANDRITPATEVHHITPVESVTSAWQMEALMYDYDNLMSLCHECHKNIHAEMFSHTKESVRRANERRTKRFIEKFL